MISVGGIQTSPDYPGLLEPLNKISDHALIATTIRASKKPRNSPKQAAPAKNSLRDAEKDTVKTYQQILNGLLPPTLEGSVEETYDTLKTAVLEANAQLPRTRQRQNDWVTPDFLELTNKKR